MNLIQIFTKKRHLSLLALIKSWFKKTKFPRIFRTITERPFLLKTISALSLVILVLMTGLLMDNLGRLLALKSKRDVVEKDKAVWQSIIQNYPGYRDGYYQAGVLSYKLGELDKANEYAQKAEEIDPSFAPADTLLRFIKLQKQR